MMTTGSFNVGGGDQPFWWYKSWSGADWPKGQKRPKVMPDNAYTMTSRSYTRSKAVLSQYQYGTWTHYPNYYYDGVGQQQPAFSGNDELALLGKLADKVRGHSFDLGVFAAESPKCIESIVNSSRAVFGLLEGIVKKDPARVLRELAHVLGQRETNFGLPFQPQNVRKKRDWRNASRFGDDPAVRARRKSDPRLNDALDRLRLGDIPSAWLALRYAWEPLLGDIAEALKFVDKLHKDRGLTFKARLARHSVVNDAVAPLQYVIEASLTRTVTYKVTLQEQLTTARSLNLVDPFSAPWEKVPLSFVVDWFIPIGTYLANLGFWGGLSCSWCRSDYSTNVSYLKTPRKSTKEQIFVGGSYNGRDAQLKRTIGTNFIVPKPSLKTLEQAFTLPHIQNAAALITGFVTSTKRLKYFS